VFPRKCFAKIKASAVTAEAFLCAMGPTQMKGLCRQHGVAALKTLEMAYEA